MAYKRGGIAQQGGYRERGIVLHSLKYSERQLIVHMLTRSRGRMSYITDLSRRSGVGNAAARNIFQPLFVLEFEASSTRGTMHRLGQCDVSPALHEIPMDIVKTSIAVFISELLYRLVREPVDDSNMYDFIEGSIISLNDMSSGVSNFHLWFLVHLAYFMGYGLPREYRSGQWLDIRQGEYCNSMPGSRLRISPEYSTTLAQLNAIPLDRVNDIGLSRIERVSLLNALTDYYSYHCDTISSVKSISMLSELF